jgi:heat shock protein HslJ
MRTRPIAAVLVLVALVAACSPGEAAGGQLEGTDWVLRSMSQAGTLTIVPDTEYIDAEFAANRVRGFSGCNNYNARYRTGGRTLFISQASVTFMACPEPSMTLEQAYLGLLDASRYFTVRRNTLTIYSSLSEPILVFDAAPRNPLRGEWRVDSFETSPNTVSTLIEGTQIEVAFGIASVGGFAGCNSFSGTYGTNGNVVRVSPLATTRLACADDIMAQETAFLTALQGAALVDQTRSDTVLLTDLGGSIKVALVRPTPELGPVDSPGASAPASIEPSVAPSLPPPTAAPTAPPTATPTAPPTPTPVPPTAAPTPAPSIAPPSPMPTVKYCALNTTEGSQVASIVYPGTWFTVAEPAELACRYFDPAEIAVPADPAELATAVRSSVDVTPFADAVTAATDPARWTVRQNVDLTVDNLPAKLVEAQSLDDAAGVPVGISRLIYLIDAGSAGTISLWTVDAVDNANYQTNAGVVTLMVGASVFQPGP